MANFDFNTLIYNPIMPIWLMGIICVMIIALKRKGVLPFIRQILIAILLFVINLRPMIPGEEMTIKKQEMNTYVLFVTDSTLSILGDDGRDGTIRLDDLKSDCEYIVNGLPGAHYGVINFNNTAVILSPFTDNADHVCNVVNSIYPIEEYYAHGTSMNVPKELMYQMLEDTSKKGDLNLVVFFMSDGECTDETIVQESYAELSKYVKGGAVLGYGTEAGGNMYFKSMYDEDEERLIEYYDETTFDYGPAVTKLDEDNLKDIAKEMGIEYIRMNNQSKLDSVINNIIKNSDVVMTDANTGSASRISNASDIYYWFVIPLMLLLVWEAISMIRKRH